MEKLKRIFALSLTLMMAVTFFACNSKESDEDDNGKADKSISVNAPEDAVKAYYKAIEKEDADSYIELMPEINKADYEKSELEEEIEFGLSELIKFYEEDYGDDIKFEVAIVKVKDLSNKKVKAIKEQYEENYDFVDVEIDEAKDIDYEITIKGSDDELTGEGTAYVIKENGEWKVYSVEDDI